MNRPRILMSEADAGGASAQPVPAVTPSEPAAQTPAAPAAPAVDVDAIASKVHDKLFAELRRSGVFGKQKPAPASTDPAPTPATPVALDPIKLRALDRSLTRAGLANEISPTQYERAERAFASEAPDDVDGWVSDYFRGFKGAQTPTPQPAAAQPAAAQPATPPKPQNERPVSDRGAPPASTVPLEEADIVTMSDSDRAALIKQKGLTWYRTKLAGQLKGRPISLR